MLVYATSRGVEVMTFWLFCLHIMFWYPYDLLIIGTRNVLRCHELLITSVRNKCICHDLSTLGVRNNFRCHCLLKTGVRNMSRVTTFWLSAYATPFVDNMTLWLMVYATCFWCHKPSDCWCTHYALMSQTFWLQAYATYFDVMIWLLMYDTYFDVTALFWVAAERFVLGSFISLSLCCFGAWCSCPCFDFMVSYYLLV